MYQSVKMLQNSQSKKNDNTSKYGGFIESNSNKEIVPSEHRCLIIILLKCVKIVFICFQCIISGLVIAYI